MNDRARRGGGAPFDIRVLGEGDVASLRAMLAMFGQAFADVPTYSARQPDDAYLKRLLSCDTFVAVAAAGACRAVLALTPRPSGPVLPRSAPCGGPEAPPSHRCR